MSAGRGFVLLPVMLTLALLALVAALLLERGGTGGATAEGRRQSDALEYAAEGGFRHAKALLDATGCLGPGVVPATALGAYSYSAVMPGTGTSEPAQTYQLPPVADAWIDRDDKNKNHDNEAELKNKTGDGKDRQSLLRFDLSSVPADFTVASATLWLNVTGTDDSGLPVEVYRITGSWAENSVDWNSFNNGYDAKLVHASFVPNGNGFLSFDMTPLVRQWVAGKAPNYGVLFVSTSDKKESKYASREAPANQRARLDVVGRPSAFYAINAVASDGNGVQRTLTRTVAGPAGSALFLDYFDAGYGGNDGTANFSGNWQEASENDGPGAGGVRVVTDSDCAYGSCLKLETGLLLSNVAVWRELSLAGAQSAVLRLHTRRRNGNFSLEISPNGGATWQTLKSVGGNNDGTQARDVFNITAYAAANTRIRLSSSALLGLGSKYVLIDDVEIEATCGP